jgi:hypothetical protein
MHMCVPEDIAAQGEVSRLGDAGVAEEGVELKVNLGRFRLQVLQVPQESVNA